MCVPIGLGTGVFWDYQIVNAEAEHEFFTQSNRQLNAKMKVGAQIQRSISARKIQQGHISPGFLKSAAEMRYVKY
ncbi:MAG: hypothetical protein JSW47_07250 [Phycisphaerales bacterium]|nr:MAG: hypothetical protein JSW47_07250 [Phycisphaerales bacterium]